MAQLFVLPPIGKTNPTEIGWEKIPCGKFQVGATRVSTLSWRSCRSKLQSILAGVQSRYLLRMYHSHKDKLGIE